MLYVTTRNNQDVFTAHRVLHENRGPDGGFYLPMRMPSFSSDEMRIWMEKPFNQCVAELLNLLFGTKLTGWDVDFSVGRYPVRLKEVRHRILLAETWHNPEWSFCRLERCLAEHLQGCQATPSSWISIGIRIAVLFGVFGELLRNGVIAPEDKLDISVVSGDFAAPVSAWYARSWGLPVGNIVCCCNENSEIWNLICHGYLRTDLVSIPTCTPLADVTLPEYLEHLIYHCGGIEEVEHFLDVCRHGNAYYPNEQTLSKLKDRLFISVTSNMRVKDTIPSVYKTHNYLISPYTALAYAGLLDYRAKKRESCHALILADFSPLCDCETVSAAMGIPVGKIREYMK